MVCQCLVGCGTSVHNSREIIILVLVAAYVLATHSEGILSATDVLVRMLMKGAAKCNNHCELQNSVNQWILERALHSRDIPGSMPASVLVESSCKLALIIRAGLCLCVP